MVNYSVLVLWRSLYCKFNPQALSTMYSYSTMAAQYCENLNQVFELFQYNFEVWKKKQICGFRSTKKAKFSELFSSCSMPEWANTSLKITLGMLLCTHYHKMLFLWVDNWQKKWFVKRNHMSASCQLYTLFCNFPCILLICHRTL